MTTNKLKTYRLSRATFFRDVLNCAVPSAKAAPEIDVQVGYDRVSDEVIFAVTRPARASAAASKAAAKIKMKAASGKKRK